MTARALNSAAISFGLVSVPVKVYSAAVSQRIAFNVLEAKTGGRPQRGRSSVTGKALEPADMVKGYEYARGQYVQLTSDELRSIQSDRTGAMEVLEFVPFDSVDQVQIEKSFYLGPDQGGDKAYQLLAQVMRLKRRAAVARWSTRGRGQLVLLCPYRDGLVMHRLRFRHEVRPFEGVDMGDPIAFTPEELALAGRLVDQRSVESFDGERYADEYTERVKELIDRKVAGVEIAPLEEQGAQVIDLFEALKRGLDRAANDGGAPSES